MNRVPLRERARNRWRALLPVLGVDTRYLTNKGGPCPMCTGRDRFRWDNKDGEGTFFCNQCGGGDGVHLVQLVNRCDFKEAAKRIEAALGDAAADRPQAQASERELFDAMARQWAKGTALTAESVAGRYLRARTGVLAFGGDLRASESVRHGPTQTDGPALLAMVRDASGAPINLHRTWVDPAAPGRKADIVKPRMVMKGALPDGCAVRLMAPGTTLGIAEGIETAYAASALFGVPCWAALTAGRLQVWAPPEGVSEVIVFGDHDPHFGGQAAAFECGRRLASSPRKLVVSVRIPRGLGEDWCDVLNAAAPAKAAA